MAETAPWIDPRELDNLCEQHPTLSRALVSLALEAYWPIKDDVASALRCLVDSQQSKVPDEATASLDFTAAVTGDTPQGSSGLNP
jgi:hypothetical protein